MYPDEDMMLQIPNNHCSTCFAHSGLVEKVNAVKEDTEDIKAGMDKMYSIMTELQREHKGMYAKIAALTAAVAFIAGYLGIHLSDLGGII